MNKSDLQKNIKGFFTPFAKQNKFMFYKPTLMIRIYKDTLHIINFELPGEGFYCRIAIQPLYIPADMISLSFGNRLNRFNINQSSMWGYGNSKQEIEKDFLQVKELLEINALKWFDDVGYPEGIIKYIESGFSENINLMVGFPPAFRSEYLGFSYLYINKPQMAIKPLQDVIEIYKDDNREWVLRQNKMISDIRNIVENEPDKICEIIGEIVLETKCNLKLKI